MFINQDNYKTVYDSQDGLDADYSDPVTIHWSREGGYEVSLPHQCDAWQITPKDVNPYHTGLTLEQAYEGIALLRASLDRATQALTRFVAEGRDL